MIENARTVYRHGFALNAHLFCGESFPKFPKITTLHLRQKKVYPESMLPARYIKPSIHEAMKFEVQYTRSIKGPVHPHRVYIDHPFQRNTSRSSRGLLRQYRCSQHRGDTVHFMTLSILIYYWRTPEHKHDTIQNSTQEKAAMNTKK